MFVTNLLDLRLQLLRPGPRRRRLRLERVSLLRLPRLVPGVFLRVRRSLGTLARQLPPQRFNLFIQIGNQFFVLFHHRFLPCRPLSTPTRPFLRGSWRR